jgi:hypothetical protein
MSEQQIIIVERPRIGLGGLIFLGLLLFLFAPKLFFRLLWLLLRLLVRMLLGR